MARLLDSSAQVDFRTRFVTIAILALILFGLLFCRLWYLQIFNGRKWRQFSDANRIEIRRIPAMRGRILDRNGKVIADSRASFDLIITPAEVEGSLEQTVDRLGQLLVWNDADRTAVIDKIRTAHPHDPVIVKRDMSRDQLALVMVRQYSLPGAEIIDSPARSYPYGTHGSHLLGYLSEVGKQDLRNLQRDEESTYRVGDIWGISGVERAFEAILKGDFGSQPVIEDAKGRPVTQEWSRDVLPVFAPKEPVPGNDLVLSIDVDVQEAAEESFTHPVGAVVALDPRNGDILALVSRPEYSPQHFARGVSSVYWNELTTDPKNPLYDRALRGLYPPGSTFKMITATAALEEKVTDPSEKIFCPGFYQLGRETKRCWRKDGHGWVDLHKALVQSCDVYFYEMGRRLGISRIAKHARSFGLGSGTGIGINREEKGLVPSEEWKRKVYNQPWVGGETLSVAIGQGALQITPIQMAVALAALSNGGRVLKPRIVLRSQNMEDKVVQAFPEIEQSRFSLQAESWRAILDALGGVVNEPGGTGFGSARSTRVKIGGKTGTAQVVGREFEKLVEDHAWFIAFAPVDDPKIVVSVIVENGGHGGSTAAPIAKKIIETYLGGIS